MQLFNRSSTVRPPGNSSGIQFFLTRGRAQAQSNGSGSVIAFTSANSGAGVSHVVRQLAAQLAKQTAQPTAIVEAERLARLQATDLIDLKTKCARTNVANLWVLRQAESANGNGHPKFESRVSGEVESVHTLRATFDHTLIDCPSINASHEASLLAPGVDGVVLVVEADRTKRDQILQARQTIEMAGGQLLALVLNKRRHLVPEWLYRLL